MESPSKILMKHIWRFQQVGGLVAVILMCLNLTFPIFEYSGWRIAQYIPSNIQLDWLLFLIIFLLVFSIALIFGLIYDKGLKLWKHKEIVGEYFASSKYSSPSKNLERRIFGGFIYLGELSF